MPEKKSWFEGKKKWIAGITAGLAGVVGVEEGIRRATDTPEKKPVIHVVDKKKPIIKKNVAPEMPKSVEPVPSKEQQRLRDVKDFIQNIANQEPVEDKSDETPVGRYNKLKEYLDGALGNRYMISEFDDDNNYFDVALRNDDGTPGESVRVSLRQDNSISVGDEGLYSEIDIEASNEQKDRVAQQIEKVMRMRDAYYKNYKSEMTDEQYDDFLRSEGYDDEQINYIKNIKYKTPEDIIKDY